MRPFRLALCLAPLALAACGGGEAPPAAAAAGPDGGTLVVAAPGDADNLLPPLSTTMVGRAVVDLVFDHLAEIGDAMNTFGDEGFTPRLASGWTWGPDSTSVVFHLDPRARWHDGQPVRAQDVRFSLALAKNPAIASPFAQALANVDSATVLDSLDAKVWFHRHTPEEFFDVAYQLWIMPAHVYDTVPPEKLATSELARHPVGSGRFRFVSWQPGSRLEIEADTGNYRGRARLDRVIWAITPDNNSAFAQVASGEADLLETAAPDQIKALAGRPGLRLFPWPTLQYGFMGMNFRAAGHRDRPNPILADQRVRRALSMAIDRRAMLRNVFDSTGHMGYGPFPAGLATADTTLSIPRYDVAHAEALLDSAGWTMGPDSIRHRGGRPLRLRLITPTSSAFRMQYAVLIQEALRRVGARVDIDAGPFNAYYAKQTAGDFDLALITYSTDPNAGGAAQSWATASIGPTGGNSLSYSDPRFDALLDSATHQPNVTQAKAYARRAYQVIADDVPAVWLYDFFAVGAISTRFRVTALRPDGWWEHLADWTVPVADRIPRDRIGLEPAKP
ncbi:MAG: peptide ABC transporter substrate-binding protein [Gemmatimonadota bacterium]|nr:peptide ABC transporter substrate-binding protein [Gemmatimonadota bacterium]MDE3127352.1 peptide ABC transporter substrate-binding protein [Gemmatimonadota bacterium]